MNTRLCNASLRVVSDHYGDVKTEIVLSYVTQVGKAIRRDKHVLGVDEIKGGFDPTLGCTAEVSHEAHANIFSFIDIIEESFLQ